MSDIFSYNYLFDYLLLIWLLVC